MKWLLQRDYLHATTYHLYAAQHPVARFRYNPATHSLRIDAKDKRLFFLRSGGLFTAHTDLLNEYGRPIARARYPDRSGGGLIDCDRTRLRFSYNEEWPALLLAGDGDAALEKVCRLSFVRSMHAGEGAGLVLALCWFLQDESGRL